MRKSEKETIGCNALKHHWKPNETKKQKLNVTFGTLALLYPPRSNPKTVRIYKTIYVKVKQDEVVLLRV